MANKRPRIETQFEEELSNTVRQAFNGDIEKPIVTKIVEHLMSDDVGVTCLADLQDVTLAMLPASLGLRPIKANRLLRHFSAPGTSGQPGTSSQSDSQQNLTSFTSQGNSSRDTSEGSGIRQRTSTGTSKNGFEFIVPFTSLPKEERDRIADCARRNVLANQGDVDVFRLALVKKLVASYKLFKDAHPGQQKHPGNRIYASITDQVFERYGPALVDIVNKKIVSDGKSSFQKAVMECTENQMRQKNQAPTIPQAVQASGVVGVLPEQYLPMITDEDRDQQEAWKAELREEHKLDSDMWQWDEMQVKMRSTYQLQRSDVAAARVEIERALEKEEENNDGEDEPRPKALAALMDAWPFLFYPCGLTWHHQRLTGRDLKPQLDGFLDDHLEYLLNFLTSCSKQSKKNMALSIKLNRIISNWTVQQKLMKCIVMLLNHFGEEKCIFIHEAEKTILSTEIDVKGLADLCIIARDDNKFKAEEFFVVADELVLVEATSFQEALLSLIHLAFTLDMNYPKTPLTFEFLERFVFGMGIADTRIKNKKGKTIIVLTPTVRVTIKELGEFEKELGDDVEIENSG